MLNLILLLVLMLLFFFFFFFFFFQFLLNFVITSLGEERIYLCASRTVMFECLSCMRYVFTFSLTLSAGDRQRIVIVTIP